jgi:phosphosulfolactate phosphohydrolase-like enzyme
LKNAVRKARNTARTVSHAVDKYAPLVEMVAPELAPAIEGFHAANAIYKKTGGNFKLKNAVRKARNTARTVSHAVDKYAPLVEMVAPELAPAIEGFHAANAIYKTTGGSVGRRNKYIEMMGGSFSVPRHGGSFNVPTHSGGGGFVQNGLISASHPALHPVPPKSLSRRKREN